PSARAGPGDVDWWGRNNSTRVQQSARIRVETASSRSRGPPPISGQRTKGPDKRRARVRRHRTKAASLVASGSVLWHWRDARQHKRPAAPARARSNRPLPRRRKDKARPPLPAAPGWADLQTRSRPRETAEN